MQRRIRGLSKRQRQFVGLARGQHDQHVIADVGDDAELAAVFLGDCDVDVVVRRVVLAMFISETAPALRKARQSRR